MKKSFSQLNILYFPFTPTSFYYRFGAVSFYNIVKAFNRMTAKTKDFSVISRAEMKIDIEASLTDGFLHNTIVSFG